MAKWNEETQSWEYAAGELEAQVENSLATETGDGGPEGLHITYLTDKGVYRVDVSTGATFIFPARMVEGLKGRSIKELRDVHILTNGDTIEWSRLDLHFSLAGLMEGSFGSAAWSGRVAAEARKAASAKGGKAKTTAKAESARINGQGGGRPIKSAAKN